MPSLAELTDYDPTVDKTAAIGIRPVMENIAPTPEPIAAPELPVIQADPNAFSPDTTVVGSALDRIVSRLTGANGQERYQTWPEKLIRSGLSAPGQVMEQGALPAGLRREDFTDIPAPTMPTKDSTALGKFLNVAPVAASPADPLIERSLDTAALAGTGGLAGTTDATLGAGPFLRPALKYKDKIYKAPEGGQHLDALPAHLADEFQQMAMSGEDISHYNFGFMNHKGQFLDREKALDYAVKEGLVDPSAGQYGALTSTLLADSSKPGVAIEAAKDWNVKGFENNNWYHGTTHDFNKFDVNRGNIENHLGQYPHFTNSPEDASANYAGHGPDLTGRIERKAEEIINAKDLKWGTPEYKKAYEDAKAQAAKEIAGPHEGAVIPAKLNLKNPADITPNGKTWIDFNPKSDKDGEWIKDHPNMTKLLNSLKKQGEKYGFNGQKAFDEVAENAELYNGDVKASDLNKALRSSEELMYAEHPEGKGMVGSHVAATVFKDLGFDGIVMDAKSAFPNMKNIKEGTLHAVPLKKNTVQSKLTGKTLFAGKYTLVPVSGNPFEEKK